MSKTTAMQTVAPVSAIAHYQDITPKQQALLRNTLCKGADDDELALYITVCNRKQLDPFSGQIHGVKRWDSESRTKVMRYQTGIDGFRIMAHRSGVFGGMDPIQWCADDGVWRDVWLARTAPRAAKARVYRTDRERPIEVIAYWDMYVQVKQDGKPNQRWENGGPHMLAKCAEALAIRQAFPIECGGVYTDDELGRTDDDDAIDAEIVDERRPADISPSARAFMGDADIETDKEKLKDLYRRARNALRGADLDLVLAHITERGKNLTASETAPDPERDDPERMPSWDADFDPSDVTPDEIVEGA